MTTSSNPVESPTSTPATRSRAIPLGIGAGVLALLAIGGLLIVHAESATNKVALSADGSGMRVNGGLAAGTRVVIAGIHSLKLGQQVRIEEDATP